MPHFERNKNLFICSHFISKYR